MKKIITCLFMVLLSFTFIGCDKRIKEYNGKELSRIYFESVDYNGGYTHIISLDFITNRVNGLSGIPDIDFDRSIKENQNTNEYTLLNEFTEEEEKDFINKIYSYGLFDINKEYHQSGIIDGSGWTLKIIYNDGSEKISNGDNASPVNVFNECAVPFYQICKQEVLGSIPSSYFNAPNIDISFTYEKDGCHYNTNTFTKVTKTKYLWNDFSEEKDIYNTNISIESEFEKGIDYTLVLSTANYQNYYDGAEKYKKIILKTYDFNRELTNESIVFESKWFDQKEIDLELNKIYVYTLIYSNNDYVEYSFNTLVKNNQ